MNAPSFGTAGLSGCAGGEGQLGELYVPKLRAMLCFGAREPIVRILQVAKARSLIASGAPSMFKL